MSFRYSTGLLCIVCLSMLAGCSNQQLFSAFQGREKALCNEQPGAAAGRDCEDPVSGDYDTYERNRTSAP